MKHGTVFALLLLTSGPVGSQTHSTPKPSVPLVVGWHDEMNTPENWKTLSLENVPDVYAERPGVLTLRLPHVPNGYPYEYQWTRRQLIIARLFPQKIRAQKELFGRHTASVRKNSRSSGSPEASMKGTPMPPLPTSPLAGKRIVTVEDEGITQLQLRKALTIAGLIVVGQACNGAEGVELILREKPDLATMDINMPVMDGLEATRQIMEADGTCVVILTSYNDEEHRHRAEEVHACGYALKPITSESLIATLERSYAQHRRQ